MQELILASYNVENMRDLFDREGQLKSEAETNERVLHISRVVASVAPHLLGVCEADHRPEAQDAFAGACLGDQYRRVLVGDPGPRRDAPGKSLAMYYREPLRDPQLNYAFEKRFFRDVDQDGINEQIHWSRVPMEVDFRVGAGECSLKVILVHGKSKGLGGIQFFEVEKAARANRKKLMGQALELRGRLDRVFSRSPDLPVVVMGDFNDDPGLDIYESQLGRSFVETVMGSVFDPRRIFHNPLAHLMTWEPEDNDSRRVKYKPGQSLFTMKFRDPILNQDDPHRAWIDHLLFSRGMMRDGVAVRGVADSGWIENGEEQKNSPDEASKSDKEALANASDHFLVAGVIEVPDPG